MAHLQHQQKHQQQHQQQPSAGGAARAISGSTPVSVSDFSTVFMYSSAIAVPLPLDSISRPGPRRREKRPRSPLLRLNSAAAAAAAAAPEASAAPSSQPASPLAPLQAHRPPRRRPQSQSRHSSTSSSQASQASHSPPPHETASASALSSNPSSTQTPPPPPSLHSYGPAAAATASGPTSTSASASVSASASASTSTSASASASASAPAPDPAATTRSNTTNTVALGHYDSPSSSSPSSSSPSSSSQFLKASSASSPPSSPSSSAISPSRSQSRRAASVAAAAAKTFPRMPRAWPNDSLLSLSLSSALDPGNASSLPDQDTIKSSTVRQMTGLTNRAESISSASGNTSISARTMTSTEPPSAAGDNQFLTRPFVQRNGRTYINDANLPYPLPSDLTELHRQTLRTLLLIQVFGAPVCSPSLTKKPPQRVLEIGCGPGFWSMMCHQYFKGRGHSGVSFTGIDIAPLAPDSSTSTSTSISTAAEAMKPDPDMKWKFVQHDLRQLPWPLPTDEYDLVMVKDMSLATTNMLHQAFIDEYIRLLRPGGTLEIWESDHLIRMLRPHVPGFAVAPDDADEQLAASSLGAYVINANTPLSAPLNAFLVDYNQWLSRALESRDLSAVPCTLIGPVLLQESEILTDVRSRRLAIPLSEVRWEREGVGGVITKDGRPHVQSKGKEPKVDKKTLTAGQVALRQTALLTVVQQVQALEPILREVSGKSQDEWDVWLGKMMGDFMSESGTSWGECLEVGAWCAKKKST